jgi:hypothetical protein
VQLDGVLYQRKPDSEPFRPMCSIGHSWVLCDPTFFVACELPNMTENPVWGEERIANELLVKLGIQVSPRTVRKYMRSGQVVSRGVTTLVSVCEEPCEKDGGV